MKAAASVTAAVRVGETSGLVRLVASAVVLEMRLVLLIVIVLASTALARRSCVKRMTNVCVKSDVAAAC